MKLQQSKNFFFLTIPKEYVKHKGWKKGQELLVLLGEKGDLLIKEAKPTD
ncbi:MAG: AbrB/MazE/SpoVT family DNA-binding domain-containing protein [Candidatus Diapherotrites archaeon]